MNIILGYFVHYYVLVFLDEILIYLAMAEDYTRHVKATFELLVKSKFYLKHKKCALFSLELEFLKYIVPKHGVSVSPSKVPAI